jgi:hypothetical protein
MGLMDALRHAEQQGKRVAHLGAERVRAGMQHAETSLRRKATGGLASHTDLPASTHPDPQQESGRLPTGKVRTGIVSVNGQDVGQMHCTGK